MSNAHVVMPVTQCDNLIKKCQQILRCRCKVQLTWLSKQFEMPHIEITKQGNAG